MPTTDPFSKRLFANAELRAERLVAVMRMVIAISLAFVLIATNVAPVAGGGPPAEIAEQLNRQWLYAGLTITAYFLLGFGSYSANRRGLYRPWMAWLTVSGDCAFLLLNLWLSIENMQISGAYAAAMPAVWVTPVVLAFGALRFNPWLQGYVVAVLAGGILGVAFAGAGTPIIPTTAPPAALGLFFSVPPNIMRLLMMVLAGIVLVVAAARARQLLAQSINEARRRANLTRYLPEQIAGRLADGGVDELRHGRRQEVAVLFTDVRNFTGQSLQMSPEALGAFITEFRRRVGSAASANGSVIDKFIGDAAMIVFGLDAKSPADRKEAARAALACADAILAEVSAWSAQRTAGGAAPVHVGVGVHFGEAYCGAIGDEDRLEFTVLGDTVNVAALLEAFTKTAGKPIAASEDVFTAAGVSTEDWEALGPVALRGRDETTVVFASGG